MPGYVIGVDGGGTKTHYALFDIEGNFVNLLTGGPSSHEVYPGGFADSRLEIQGCISKLLKQNQLKPEDIGYGVFGIAGVDIKKQHDEVSRIITETGLKDFEVMNDAFLGIKVS